MSTRNRHGQMQRMGLVGVLLVCVSTGFPAAASSGLGDTYADIAAAGYRDSLAGATLLRQAIADLIETPTKATLETARETWKQARIPYLQTEVFRFGNPLVDDWEGRVNAWPLDEGLIDYVAIGDGEDTGTSRINVIANPVLMVAGREVDATVISEPLLREVLHEAEGIEANVATGYHAIEFLLWGQDLDPHGAGARPVTDFDPANCTGGQCDRRIAYLEQVAELLVADLAWMAKAWESGGEARQALGDEQQSIRAALTGLGSLAYGELAGERMQLGLLLHDPEEEQDCFSDNTHESHYWNAVGLRNVYLGQYQQADGSFLEGPSLASRLGVEAPELDAEIRRRLGIVLDALDAIRIRVADGKAYDQMLAEGDPDGVLIENAVGVLAELADALGRVGPVLEVGQVAFEGSDSLDSPDAVFE